MGLDSVAHVAPSRAPKRVSDRLDGTERVCGDFSAMCSIAEGRGSGCISLEGREFIIFAKSYTHDAFVVHGTDVILNETQLAGRCSKVLVV